MLAQTEPEGNGAPQEGYFLMSAKADRDAGVIRVSIYLERIVKLAATVGTDAASRFFSTELLAISRAVLLAAGTEEVETEGGMGENARCNNA